MKRIRAVGCYIVAAVLLFGMLSLFGCKEEEDAEYFSGAVTYEEFGAVGDGTTDDFEALKKAHDHANENGVPVKAKDGATYYIAPHEKTITVKTSTDWGKAKFIINDRAAEEESQVWWYPLFDVRPDKESVNVELPTGYSLAAGQNNIGLTFEEPVMLRIVNANKKDYIRYGSNQDGGDSRQEVILVDKEGRVEESTPLLWDYSEVTLMTAYSVTERPILLKGGEFTTVANATSRILHYFNRAIDVKRSNTVVKNVKHYVTGEGETGSPYNGFFLVNYANSVTFEGCTLTGHKYYLNENGVSQGTYDTRLNCSNNVTYLNCTQSNSATDTAYWGVMCSDYCKNVTMDGCKVSRFDAHKGVYNATIRNSELGQNISVCGGGTLLLENVVRISPEGSSGLNRFITLRYDYGSSWRGDIVIRNSKLITYRGLNYVIDTSWYDWDFGFPCCFPRTVTLDNVEVEFACEIDYFHGNYVFGFITEAEGNTPAFMQASKNPVTLPEGIIIKNCKTQFTKTANCLGWLEQTPFTVES